jgi:TRAP-type C4-dicarboxylate transport system permease small subunit
MVERASALYGRLIAGLALLACGVLFLMMLMICADVLLRNVALLPHLRGLPFANEFSEYMLYLITLLAAPWLLRRGQHIRIDILLRGFPPRLGWYAEWLGDALALVVCLLIAFYSAKAALASHAGGSLIIKAVVIPEWWLIAPMPAIFALLAVEVLFRMHRLYRGERAPRGDAVALG